MSRPSESTAVDAHVSPTAAESTTITRYRTIDVDGLKLFYREAGASEAPALLLLHGFPTSSHMYRDLIPALADRYHVVAPDLPGFGFTEAPERKRFKYSFEHLAEVIERFTEAIGLNRYVLYVFDYGAPIGFRLAIRHPERITAVISQNGNAYLQGLSEGWNPIQAYWKEPSPENRAALRAFLKPEATEWQYRHGVPTPERLSSDAWALDAALLARYGNDEIQLDLFGDYQSNVALYPKFQEYFRTQRPPLLNHWLAPRTNKPVHGPFAHRWQIRDGKLLGSTCTRHASNPSRAELNACRGGVCDRGKAVERYCIHTERQGYAGAPRLT